MERLFGTGVALVTPFNSNLEIDFTALKRLLEFTASKGADYYVVMGTTGESATLSSSEKYQVLEFVKENNSQELPIVYGIGGNNTQNVLSSIASSDLAGVDALLSVSPYYNKPSQEGIFHHYSKIADASPLPVILYNVPGRTGSNITADTTLRLANHPNISGTKEASGDFEQAMTIVKHKPADFMLISGDDMLSVPLYALGASGIISVLANAFSDVFKSIHTSVKSNDFEAATGHLAGLLEINPLMYEQSNPVGVKQVLDYFDICENYVRLPLVSASHELKSRIKSVLDNM